MASVQSGLLTFLPAFFRPSNACCSVSVVIAGRAGEQAYRRGYFVNQVPVWEESVQANRRVKRKGLRRGVRTNIQEDSAVQLLVDNMGLEDLVVERLWRSLGSGHCETVRAVRTCAVCAWRSRRLRQFETSGSAKSVVSMRRPLYAEPG